jgi:hypothetical protein
MKLLLSFLFAALFVLSGCNSDRDHEKHEDKPKAAKPKDVKAAPAIEGKYEGRWESEGHKGHGGGLTCEVKKSSTNEWAAVFTAEFGKTKSYNVNLKGKPDGDKVVFGGQVDLGKDDGGVFTWKGKATDKEFNGEYEGGGDKGSFKMARAAK